MSDVNPDELVRDRKYDQIFAALAHPFDGNEVRERSQSGRSFRYITARVAMNRLDDVIGAGFWEDTYTPGENSVMCRLTIELPDGRKVTKADAGGYAGMADSGDDDKSRFSDAFKRAAAKFGVGRYLYGDGMPHNVREAMGEVIEHHAPASQARPAPTDGGNGFSSRGEGPGPGHRPGGPPQTGRALFAWLKEQEQRHEVGLIKWANAYMKLQDMPGRIVDLDRDQVAIVHGESVKKLQTITQTSAEAYEEALQN